MKIIPFDPSISARQTFNVNLGELVCEFHFHWNERVASWFCDFKTTTGENSTVRLVENRSLLGNNNVTGLPGDFRVLRMNRLETDGITYDNFGTSWRLVYGTDDEWETFDGVSA